MNTFQKKNTAFVHIPKTGGTSLNYVYQATYSFFLPDEKTLEQTSILPDHSFYRAAASADYSYVAGHIPFSILKKEHYKRFVTIIRNPVDILASIYSFAGRYNLVQNLLDFYKSPILASYYAPRFFLERFCIELSYGFRFSFLGSDYYSCESVSSAVDTLKLFDVVIDFNDYENQVKKLVFDDGLYPFSILPASRRYSYDKDAAQQFALANISDFDREFYSLYATARKNTPYVGFSYEEYRIGFCKSYGINIDCGSDIHYDLSLPVGLGWHPVEHSELSRPFRWGESVSTIEIPLRNKGHYRLFFYFGNCKPTELDYSVSFEPSGFLLNSSLNDMVGIVKMSLEIRIEAASWVVIKLSASPRILEYNSTDLRDCALTLGDICIERLV